MKGGGQGGKGRGGTGRGGKGRGGSARKDMQLCSEVRRSLDLVLAESTDGRLAGAWVAEVTPAPDTSRLLVVVELREGGDVDAAHQMLGEMHGFLRSEIASAVDRKKVPDLFFQVRLPSRD